jgi:hypothetical protein
VTITRQTLIRPTEAGQTLIGVTFEAADRIASN